MLEEDIISYFRRVKHNYTSKSNFQFKFTIGNRLFCSPAQFGLEQLGGFLYQAEIELLHQNSPLSFQASTKDLFSSKTHFTIPGGLQVDR